MAKFVLDFEKPVIELEKKIEEMRKLDESLDLGDQIVILESKVDELRLSIYKNLTRWQRVQIARHPERPITQDYLNGIFEDFTELHGDRKFKDDHAIIGGMAKLNGVNVMVVGHQKGRDTKSNLYRNFGMPNPEGYRKAERLFKMAEKFGNPIITLLDTPGAFPGLEAEERGQAEAIANNLKIMANLKVPIIVVIIGEGASGGAIGIGIGDRILMLENAWYSVISPESCSSILYKSWDFKEQAAESLKLSATDLITQGIVDRIVQEPVGGAHTNHQEMIDTLKAILIEELTKLKKTKKSDMMTERTNKFMKMGVWTE